MPRTLALALLLIPPGCRACEPVLLACVVDGDCPPEQACASGICANAANAAGPISDAGDVADAGDDVDGGGDIDGGDDVDAGADAGACANDPAWWDPSFSRRGRVDTGGAPAGYTLTIDASSLASWLRANAADLRAVVDEGATKLEVDRVVAAVSPVLLVDARAPGAGDLWLYAGNPAAGAPLADARSVYLFAESFEGFAAGDNASAVFAPEPAAEWNVVVEGGNHHYRAAGSGRHPAAIRGLTLVNGDIRARMRVGVNGTDNHDGLAARSNSMLPASMDGLVGQLLENVDYARIGDYVNGASPVELATFGRAVDRGVWYQMRLRFVGDVVEVYTDGVQQARATGASADGALLGLFAYSCEVDYDDVRVRAAIEPEPVAMLGAAEQLCPP